MRHKLNESVYFSRSPHSVINTNIVFLLNYSGTKLHYFYCSLCCVVVVRCFRPLHLHTDSEFASFNRVHVLARKIIALNAHSAYTVYYIESFSLRLHEKLERHVPIHIVYTLIRLSRRVKLYENTTTQLVNRYCYVTIVCRRKKN